MPLFCQNCGQEHSSYVDVCPSCGQHQPTGPSSVNVTIPAHSSDLCGVGGWLLFLCISLTFIAPIGQALVAARALRNLAIARVPIQTLLRLGSVGGIYAGLAIFSCIAGAMLWMEKPEAVKVAKAYLLIAALLPISLFLMLDLAGLQVDLVKIIFRRLVYSVTWYCYLTTSHRVKLTYGTP